MVPAEIFTADMISKFIKFSVVGATGMVIDFGITFLAKEKFRIQKYVANGMGFSTAVVSNYMLNRIWTFGSTSGQVVHEFSIFFGAALVGLTINSFILWLLVSKGHKKFYHSKLFAIAVVTLWNFSFNYFVTFQRN